MNCKSCGTPNAQNAKFCVKCGAKLMDEQTATTSAPVQAPVQTAPTVIANNSVAPAQSNGIGIAGFVCAIVAVFACVIPILGWIVWLVGAILSIIGIFRQPRGLAIAGTVISFIDVIILIVVVGGIATIGLGSLVL